MLQKFPLKTWSYPLLSLACIAVYSMVVTFDFQLRWDDQWMIMNHYTERGFTWHNIRAIFTEFYYAQYSPINQLIYTAIFSVFGFNPAVYHLYPLLLHIMNTCLMMLFIQRLFCGRTDAVTLRQVAFFTALLFAIHPLQVESVAWISASKIPLYTLFGLLMMLSYMRYVRTGKTRFYLLAFLMLVFSFGSKEQSVMLPLLLPLIDWVLRRTPLACGEDMASEGEGITKRSWWYLLAEKMPFLLFSLVAGLITYFNQSAAVIAEWAGYPFGQRMVFGAYSLVEYIGTLVAPVNLLYFYPFPMAPGYPFPLHFLIYPIVVIVAAGFLFKTLKREHWPIIFGLLWFLINMALVLHVVAMSRLTIMADRYMYLSSVGLFFIATWYGVPFIKKTLAGGKKWALAVAVCYMLYLGIFAHIRTYAWRDSDTLRRELIELIEPTELVEPAEDVEPVELVEPVEDSEQPPNQNSEPE